jgi:hypothetical protein
VGVGELPAANDVVEVGFLVVLEEGRTIDGLDIRWFSDRPEGSRRMQMPL